MPRIIPHGMTYMNMLKAYITIFETISRTESTTNKTCVNLNPNGVHINIKIFPKP